LQTLFAYDISYDAQFTKLSGGLEGGADPPAFQRAEKQRLKAAERAEEAAAGKEAPLEESFCETHHSDVENPRKVIVPCVCVGGKGGCIHGVTSKETCPFPSKYA
jgi:hypothetical protein